jgi:PHD/YefM family antitoxin component YafN of YafNO toxin-antitoxin module
MSDELHRKTYDVTIAAQSLAQLHEYVTGSNARIEITRPGSNERCVLISKLELDALERALEILSNTEEVRHISEKIAQLIAGATANDFAHV